MTLIPFAYRKTEISTSPMHLHGTEKDMLIMLVYFFFAEGFQVSRNLNQVHQAGLNLIRIVIKTNIFCFK